MKHELKPMAIRTLFRVQQAVGMTPTEFRAVSLFAFLLFAGMTGKRILDRPHPIDPAVYAAADAAFRARAGEVVGRAAVGNLTSYDSTVALPVLPGDSSAPAGGDTVRNARRAARASIVELNTASARELMTLPRIGPAIAGRILEHRARNGPFRFVDDLLMVRGIGEKTLEQLRPLVRVENQRAQEDSTASNR